MNQTAEAAYFFLTFDDNTYTVLAAANGRHQRPVLFDIPVWLHSCKAFWLHEVPRLNLMRVLLATSEL